jgi:hypothetical protein
MPGLNKATIRSIVETQLQSAFTTGKEPSLKELSKQIAIAVAEAIDRNNKTMKVSK